MDQGEYRLGGACVGKRLSRDKLFRHGGSRTTTSAGTGRRRASRRRVSPRRRRPRSDLFRKARPATDQRYIVRRSRCVRPRPGRAQEGQSQYRATSQKGGTIGSFAAKASRERNPHIPLAGSGRRSKFRPGWRAVRFHLRRPVDGRNIGRSSHRRPDPSGASVSRVGPANGFGRQGRPR